MIIMQMMRRQCVNAPHLVEALASRKVLDHFRGRDIRLLMTFPVHV